MPQDTLMIRRATLNDLHKICELGQVVNQLHHQAYPGIFLPQNEPLRDMAHWQRAVQGDDSVCFVALGETQGPALGFVTAYQVDESHSMLHPMRYLRIGTVCVDVAVRGQGIACRLMAEVQAWGRHQGAVDVRLHVWQFNESAKCLYAELGYEVRGLNLGKVLV